jgi:hypothetical protein
VDDVADWIEEISIRLQVVRADCVEPEVARIVVLLGCGRAIAVVDFDRLAPRVVLDPGDDGLARRADRGLRATYVVAILDELTIRKIAG